MRRAALLACILALATSSAGSAAAGTAVIVGKQGGPAARGAAWTGAG